MTAVTLDPEKRYSRQKDIVPLAVLDKTEVSVIGIGAIGRQICLQLAAMGIQNLHLLDFDKVEESNIASQGYMEGDIGKYKVDATGKLCKKINATINLRAERDRFRLNTDLGQIVFLCVDSIDTRSHIWHAIRGHTRFFVDGRMSAEVYRVLTVTEPDTQEYYETTLFPEHEAQQGACTAKTTIFCANAVSSWMISNFAKWMRGMPVAKDMLVNMLSNEVIMDAEKKEAEAPPQPPPPFARVVAVPADGGMAEHIADDFEEEVDEENGDYDEDHPDIDEEPPEDDVAF